MLLIRIFAEGSDLAWLKILLSPIAAFVSYPSGQLGLWSKKVDESLSSSNG